MGKEGGWDIFCKMEPSCTEIQCWLFKPYPPNLSVAFDIIEDFFFLESTCFLFQCYLPWSPGFPSTSLEASSQKLCCLLLVRLLFLEMKVWLNVLPKAPSHFTDGKRRLRELRGCPRSLKQQEAKSRLDLMCDSDVLAL